MKPSKVNYKKVFNLGNYSNEQIGVEIELNESDNVQEAIRQARNFVTLNSEEIAKKVDECDHIVSNPDDFTGRQIQAAKKFLAEIEEMQKSLPNVSMLTEHKE